MKVIHIKKGIIEYKGDFYTAEELAEHLSIHENYEVILHENNETWFGEAMEEMEEKQ